MRLHCTLCQAIQNNPEILYVSTEEKRVVQTLQWQALSLLRPSAMGIHRLCDGQTRHDDSGVAH